MAPTSTDIYEQLQLRAWEAVDSLVQTLGSTLDVRDVARRSLLTVTGQLLVRKAAFFLLEESTASLRLCECIGVLQERIDTGPIPIDSCPSDFFGRQEDLLTVGSAAGLPYPLLDHFDYVARIVDGKDVLGLVFLGGKLGAESFGPMDSRLLRTMGMVIGSTLRRSLVHQKLVEANIRLENAQRLQTQILDHVSHEFNTPLMVLRSTSDLVYAADPEELEEISRMQLESLDRLETLVKGILSMGSAISEGRQSPIGLRDFVENLLQPTLAGSAWTAGDRIEDHQVIEDGYLVIDPESLRVVLGALLTNAWVFAGEAGGRLAARSYPVVRSEWEDEPDALRLDRALPGEGPRERATPEGEVSSVELSGVDAFVIEIADDGIGIPPDEVDMVQQPFTQGSNSPFHQVRGAGMGLPTARKRLVDMDCNLDLVSELGRGTVASVVIPLRVGPLP